MELEGKRVLVTGAGGFIGSHLVERLIEKNAIVRVFLRYNSRGDLGNLRELSKENLARLEIFRGDIKDSSSVRNAVKDIDIIFHLGALISIPYSYSNPRDFIESNTLGTLNLLEAARDFKSKKVIITSTSETYGTAIYSPIDEKHPLQAQSPYSASKIGADKIGESFWKSFGVPIAIIRPFNTFGPRQSIRAIIPTIIYQAIVSEKLKLGSLFPKRDFTYVEDTVNGFIKIAESEKSVGEVINISSGKTISIGELVEKIGQILSKKLEVQTEDYKIRPINSEVNLLLGENFKAKQLIGWEPQVSFENGLIKTIKYIQENMEKYKSEEGNI